MGRPGARRIEQRHDREGDGGGNGKSGVQFTDSTDSLVTRSTLTGNPSDGVTFFLGATGNRVEYSTFSGNFDGIGLWGDENEVVGNTVAGSEQEGVLVRSGANDSSISGNDASGSGDYDLFDGNASCDSNTWTGNTYGSRNQGCIN